MPGFSTDGPEYHDGNKNVPENGNYKKGKWFMRFLIITALSAILALLLLITNGCGSDAPAKDHGSTQPPVSAPPENPGQNIFQTNCAVCHGIRGKGDGQAAVALPKKPKDLTLPEIQGLSDNVLSQKIRAGVPENSMPPWKHLSDKEISDLVAYIKTLK